MVATGSEETTPEWTERHQRLIDSLVDENLIRSTSVAEAFRSVPRHLFLPNIPFDQVYSNEAIATKTEAGRAISSSSQPAMMAIMLEQLALKPGQRVLEIGAGTGYNAALMAYLVGDKGHVVTMDIDDDIVVSARHHLAEAGFGRVEVICADGALGHAPAAPYDRIILTVGAWDIAPAWREQLAEDGRLVIPLSLNGPQQSIAFIRSGSRLESVSIHGCGFIPLRGSFAGPEASVSLAPEPGLEISYDGRRPLDTANLLQWLSGPFQEQATGIEAGLIEIWFGLHLWLALREPGLCTLNASGPWAERRVVPYLFGSEREQRGVFTTALFDEDGLAVLSRPPGQPLPWHQKPENVPFELYLCAYGPGETAAHRLLEQVRAWDKAGRPKGEQYAIRIHPAEENYLPQANEIILKKRWTHMVINWNCTY
jgi:protein-L-isoaspartate(D-aspartate) O-methyltransferase